MLIIYVINIAQSPVSPSPLSPSLPRCCCSCNMHSPICHNHIHNLRFSLQWQLVAGEARRHWGSPSTWRTHSKWIDIQLCQHNAPATPLSYLSPSLSSCTVQTTSRWGRGKQLSPTPPWHGRAQTINIYLGLQFIFYDIWCGCNCC